MPMHTRIAVLFLALASSVAAQESDAPPARPARISPRAHAVEVAIARAVEQFAHAREAAERNVKVLAHLRAADDALADPMQPHVAIESAWRDVNKAYDLKPDILVQEGVIRLRNELESARRSPTTTDFGRLRSLLRTEAMGPASRVASRHAARLQEELLAWFAVHDLVGAHLQSIGRAAGESLQAAQQ